MPPDALPGSATYVRVLDCWLMAYGLSDSIVNEMNRLSTQCLPSEPVPKILSLPKDSWMKISHLNVRSFLAKYEDIGDQPMRQVEHVLHRDLPPAWTAP